MANPAAVTLIRHHHNALELHDNAAVHLASRGCHVRHRFPFDGDRLELRQLSPTIVLGGSQNVTDLHKYDYLREELKWIETCLRFEIPLLGICLGAQLIAHVLGARVSAREPAECEFGFYEVHPTAAAEQWLPESMHFVQAHYQEFGLPAGAERLAFSEQFEQQAYRYGTHTLAVQFHPEVNRAIFHDWMTDGWSVAMAATPGAQSKEQQSRLLEIHVDRQAQWFRAVLDQLFCSADLDGKVYRG